MAEKQETYTLKEGHEEVIAHRKPLVKHDITLKFII